MPSPVRSKRLPMPAPHHPSLGRAWWRGSACEYHPGVLGPRGSHQSGSGEDIQQSSPEPVHSLVKSLICLSRLQYISQIHSSPLFSLAWTTIIPCLDRTPARSLLTSGPPLIQQLYFPPSSLVVCLNVPQIVSLPCFKTSTGLVLR